MLKIIPPKGLQNLKEKYLMFKVTNLGEKAFIFFSLLSSSYVFFKYRYKFCPI
jgi:hypothetical protein